MSRSVDVVGVRAVPAPPAHVVARALRRDALQRAVERLDAQLRPLAVLGHRRGRDHRVVHRRQEGVVDLQAQAGVDDRAVLLVERVGEGEDELLVAAVVLVDADRHRARRRDDRQEALGDAGGVHPRLEVGDVARDRLLARVADGPDADGLAAVAHAAGDRVAAEVVVVELVVVAPVAPLAGRILGTDVPRRVERALLEAVEAVADVPRPRERLAELAVAHDVDADLAPGAARPRRRSRAGTPRRPRGRSRRRSPGRG